MTQMSHYMTLDEIRNERAALLRQLEARGLSEDEVYEHAASWRLRPDERAIFQRISDFDWMLSVGKKDSSGHDVVAV